MEYGLAPRTEWRTIMIKERMEEIIDLLTSSDKDTQKFDRGNATAGTRVRKQAMEAIKLLKDMRAEIIEVRNQRKSE